MVIEEGLLERMERFSLRQTLNGSDFAAAGLNGQKDAGAHDGAIQKHGAGPARAMLASQIDAGKAEIFPEKVSEGFPRLHLALKALVIDDEGDLHEVWRHKKSDAAQVGLARLTVR
jgi:hypothetical protein